MIRHVAVVALVLVMVADAAEARRAIDLAADDGRRWSSSSLPPN